MKSFPNSILWTHSLHSLKIFTKIAHSPTKTLNGQRNSNTFYSVMHDLHINKKTNHKSDVLIMHKFKIITIIIGSFYLEISIRLNLKIYYLQQ